MKTLLYIKEFLKDKNVASLTPTSNNIIKTISNKINFNKNIIIVEYGPGAGVFTNNFLKKMNKDSKLIALESNSKFTRVLRKLKDSRLLAHNEKAENIKYLLGNLGINSQNSIDYIISGIPFSYFNDDLKEHIIKTSHEILKPKGKFLAYQFSKQVEKPLSKYFKKIKTSRGVLNIPPLFIFEAVK
jgi:phosphatidylethanolamine/phosphatidyl-N-methylethanolamine N-methyltransferase